MLCYDMKASRTTGPVVNAALKIEFCKALCLANQEDLPALHESVDLEDIYNTCLSKDHPVGNDRHLRHVLSLQKYWGARTLHLE